MFDALNCETLSKPVVDQLLVLTRGACFSCVFSVDCQVLIIPSFYSPCTIAMEARDRPNALAIHVDLLTRGSQTDDIGLWMAGVKQLIMRL